MGSKEDVKADDVEWTVEEYAKDLDYFHNVIGLPKEGKIPKDITAEDVSPAALEQHFGVKDKKNGYKKEGIKGIPAEYIQRLTCALDGLEKFQPYTLEVARGLYYDCILKKPVNWAACGVDKHRGQLRLRLVRKTPPQFHLPPWKRVERKFNAPVEDVKTERESKEENREEGTPSKLRTAEDTVEPVLKHATPKQTRLEEKEVAPQHLSSKKKMTTPKSVKVKLETESKQGDCLASPTKVTPIKEEAPKTESRMETPKMKIVVETNVPAQVADLVGGGSHLNHTSQDNQEIGEENEKEDNSPGIQTGLRDGEATLAVVKVWLQIVEDSLDKLHTSQKAAREEATAFAARMAGVTAKLKQITRRLKDLQTEKDIQRDVIKSIEERLEEKLAEKSRLENDIALLEENLSDGEHDPEGANDRVIRDGFREKLMECCNHTHALQTAKTDSEVKESSMFEEAKALMSRLSEFDDQETFGKSTLKKLEETAGQLTQSYDFLKAECSLLKEHLGRGVVYVRPIPIMCPLQSEESSFSITECPVCSLGFFCHNWVPTPCGHCYHPSCLFPLLSPQDDGGAPKCVACSQLFHRSWLQCWGSSQADHHQIIELADEWELEDQASSFKKSLTEFYDNNALTIQGRRKHHEAKRKKVTKSYSRDTVKESTKFHETISRAGHVGLQCAAKSLKPPKNCGHPTDLSDGHSSGMRTHCAARTSDGKKVKVELAVVKFDKGSTPSTPGVGSVVNDLQILTEAADCLKKRKRDDKCTASSVVKGKLKKSPSKEAASESAKTPNVKSGRELRGGRRS